jgi:hypothetical protein
MGRLLLGEHKKLGASPLTELRKPFDSVIRAIQ